MTVPHEPASLVTGAAGFIGARLVGALVADGHRVTAIDRVPWAGAERLHPVSSERLTYHSVDMQDPTPLRSVVEGHATVYHLASNTENRADLAEPTADFRITAGTTVALLEAVAAAVPDVVVLASSQLVYGLSEGVLDEDTTPLRPSTPFAAGKVAAEAFLSAYAHGSGFRSVAARLSNVVGPGIRRGIVHDLVAKLGDDPSAVHVLGDGRQTRSYVHVDDCVAALRLAAERCDVPFRPVNVCNRDATSAAAVAAIVSEECPGARRPGIRFGGGTRGWSGDVPTLTVRPDTLDSWGWKPGWDSDAAVRATVRALFEESAP